MSIHESTYRSNISLETYCLQGSVYSKRYQSSTAALDKEPSTTESEAVVTKAQSKCLFFDIFNFLTRVVIVKI